MTTLFVFEGLMNLPRIVPNQFIFSVYYDLVIQMNIVQTNLYIGDFGVEPRQCVKLHDTEQ